MIFTCIFVRDARYSFFANCAPAGRKSITLLNQNEKFGTFTRYKLGHRPSRVVFIRRDIERSRRVSSTIHHLLGSTPKNIWISIPQLNDY